MPCCCPDCQSKISYGVFLKGKKKKRYVNLNAWNYHFVITTSSVIADAGCCLKFDAGPRKYYECPKTCETCISVCENTILHTNRKVYDAQNATIGQTKNLQQTYQRCSF